MSRTWSDWFLQTLWGKPTLNSILEYIRDTKRTLRDRKEYFYKHISNPMFEELRKPERSKDLYLIAEIISSCEYAHGN